MAEGRHGVILWSAQSVQGTPVTPATSAGIASYSVDLAAGGGVAAIPTIGKNVPQQLREDVIQTDFTIDITAFQTSAFLANGISTAGVLPWNTLGMGRDPDTGSSDLWQIQDCKIHRLGFRCGNTGPISVNLSGVGGLKTDLTSGAAAHLSPLVKMSYDAILTRNGSAFEFLEFSADINHTVRVQHVGHGTAASNNRLWSYQDEGALRLSGSIQRRESHDVDLQAAAQTACTLTLLITDSVGGNDITLAFTGVKFGTESRANAPDGQEIFTTPWQALAVTVT